MILLTITTSCFERILDKCDQRSPIRSLVLSGQVVYDRRAATKVVRIVCELSDAEMLRDVTKTVCPDETAEIERAIRLARRVP
jgi:hypothetical protein